MQVTPAFVPAPALPALGGAVNGIIPTGGVLGGAVAGARAGAFFGPKGAILGGIAGAIAAGLLLPLPTAPGTLPGTSDPFGPANGRPQNGTAEGVSDFSPSGQTGTNGGVCTVRGKIKCRRGYKCNDNFELSITRSFSYGPGGGKLRVDWGGPFASGRAGQTDRRNPNGHPSNHRSGGNCDWGSAGLAGPVRRLSASEAVQTRFACSGLQAESASGSSPRTCP